MPKDYLWGGGGGVIVIGAPLGPLHPILNMLVFGCADVFEEK